MKLKLIYDNESDIPDGFAALYAEQGGKWVLVGVEGMKTEKDTKALKDVADKERKLRADAESKLKKFEKLADKDPEALLKLEDEVEELKAKLEAGGTGDAKGAEANQKAIDAAVRTATGPLTRKIATLETDVAKWKTEAEAETLKTTTLKGSIKKSAVQAALTKAASESKVKSTAIGDVLMHAGVFDVEENEQGEVVSIRTRDGVGVTPGLDVNGWLGERKEKSPHWWPESQGGGATGSKGGATTGDNPFATKTANISQMSAMIQKDPARATALAKSAGFDSPEAAAIAAAKAAR